MASRTANSPTRWRPNFPPGSTRETVYRAAIAIMEADSEPGGDEAYERSWHDLEAAARRWVGEPEK